LSQRLLVVAGPLKELSFALPESEITVGRDPSNVFSINDPSLSRRHCVLIRNGDSYIIRDLGSRHGTLINGVAVEEAQLNHGDMISAGDSSFVLLLGDDDEQPSGEKVEFEDGAAQATAQLRLQDVLYLQPDRMLKELPENLRVLQNFNALLRIGGVVHSIRDLSELQARILELIFEVTPAERGAILLDVKDGRFSAAFARHRAEAETEPIRVSRTISNQVLEQKVAVLGSDIASSGQFGQVESLVRSKVRSLLCVPLVMFGKVTGCIYLDTTNAESRFDYDHLQLVAAIAGTSAIALENARRLQWLEEENRRLQTEINLEHNLVGESMRMKEVYKFLAQVAPSDSTVLIQGESGTGKEIAARAIHRNSPRGRKPFLAINCAAIPEGLLESELFGHERGSFTGAIAQKKGRLEVADGGTVFLDEIGELAPPLQVKLLRVLQEHEFERVGGTRPISVDIRVIAATNRDLEEAVKNKSFRSDLYYRLNVLSLTMPALRDHRDDILTLAGHFAAKCSRECNTKLKSISEEAMACLVRYDWPGNVRELENAIERALVLSLSDEIRPEDLPDSVLEKTAENDATARYHREVKNLKRQLIFTAWQESKGSYTETARILGLHVNYLHRLIRNLDLRDSLNSSTEASRLAPAKPKAIETLRRPGNVKRDPMHGPLQDSRQL